MVAREVAPQDRRRDLPTDPRDGWREFSLGRAPRIHGELLKLGITVSQATVSRYMPRSPKDRRSHVWRTFIGNHAIAMVQSRSFDENNWARDLLSQVRSRSRVFTCRLSAFCRCIGHRSVVLSSLVSGKSIPCCCSSPTRLVFQNCSGSQIQGAGAVTPADYSQSRSFDDRSNSRPTHPTRAETSRGLLINALNRQTFVFYALHGTASSSNRPYCQSTVRASNCHPGAASYSELCFRGRYVCG